VIVDETFVGGKPGNKHQQGPSSQLPSGGGSKKARQ
jgi:hypothetical protein